MPIDTSFHNTYLFPRYPGQNAFGVPGKLKKGHIFALRTPAAASASPGSGDGEGVGDRQAEQAEDSDQLPENAVVTNRGTWDSFPSNLHLAHISFYEAWQVAGTYYENHQELIQNGLWFPQDNDGNWVYLDGTPVPEDGGSAAAYGSMLASIPQWRLFTDGDGNKFIYHTIDVNGTQIGYIESESEHNNPSEYTDASDHQFRLEEASAPTTAGGSNVANPNNNLKSAGVVHRPIIDYTRYKTFQFNPPAWEFDYALMNTAPEDSLLGGGSASTRAPGFVTTSQKISFDRTMEVYAATNGTNPAVDPIFAKVGVQQDVFELFKVMMDPQDYEDVIQPEIEAAADGAKFQPNLLALKRPTSMNEMNEVMFDIANGGAKIAFAPIAIVYNDYFTIQGWVTGIHVVYAAFNNRLVPTMAAVDLDIEVLNVAQASANTLLNSGAGAITLDPTSLSSSVPSASGGTSGKQRTITRDQLRYGRSPQSGNSLRLTAV